LIDVTPAVDLADNLLAKETAINLMLDGREAELEMFNSMRLNIM
jgi:hypothetical protein